MAARAHLGYIFWVSDFVQPGGNMIVKPVNEIVFFMANPAPPQCGLGYTGTDLFKKRKRPVQGVVMTVFTFRQVFRKFFGVAVCVTLTMHAGSQKISGILMGEFLFTGGFNNMALG